MRVRPLVALVAASLAVSGAARAADYIVDPLTDPAFAARGGVQGGSFDANGWTTTGPTDTVWWEIADALQTGSITYSVRGLAWMNGGPLSGNDHDIFVMYQAPTGYAEPVQYSPYFRDNDFKVFTRIFGAMETGRSGAMKLEVAKCPRGDPWFHSDPCDPSCDGSGLAYANGNQNDVGWDPTVWYQMGITWSDGMVSFSRDGVVLGTVTFAGSYAPQPLRVRLGSPRDGVYPTAVMPIGLTFKDVTISGDPGAMTPVCVAAGTGGAGGTSGAAGAGGTGGATGGTEIAPLQDVTAASWETGVFPDVTDLNVEGDGTNPTAVVYLRFPPPPGPVAHAELRMRTHAYDSAAGDTGVVYAVADDTWSEDTMTWATHPAWSGGPHGTSVMIAADSLAGWDVTDLVASGVVNFAVVSTGADGAHFRSKEEPTGDGPKLVVDVVAAGGAAGATSSGGGANAGTGGSIAGTSGGGTSSAGTSSGGKPGGTSGAAGFPAAGGGSGGAIGGAAGSSGSSGAPSFVTLPGNSDAGSDGGGCGCRASSSREGSFALVAVAAALAATRRRRR